MKLKSVDGEMYIDHGEEEVKVFFDDQEIDEEFETNERFTIVVVNRSGKILRIGRNYYDDGYKESQTG